MSDGTESEAKDKTDKKKSQVQANWFGNLVYWLIGIAWLGALTPNSPLAFIPNLIGLW